MVFVTINRIPDFFLLVDKYKKLYNNKTGAPPRHVGPTSTTVRIRWHSCKRWSNQIPTCICNI